jgi:hypothetical protein
MIRIISRIVSPTRGSMQEMAALYEGFRFAAHPRYDLFRPPGSGIAMICRAQEAKR